MALNEGIFREYDIRGLVETELDPPAIELLGKAIGTRLIRGFKAKKVAVGFDMRHSSKPLLAALTKGLASTGLDVNVIGMVPTPVLYYSLFETDVDGGVMITASHSPSEYNGFKICAGTQAMHGDEIRGLYKIAMSGDFESGEGKIEEAPLMDRYMDCLRSKLKISRPVKVVVDSGNGMAGITGPGLFKELGCDVIDIYSEPDGDFPNHHPDPTVEKNLEDLKKKVAETGAELGIGFDGDGDRIGMVDDTGRAIWGDELLALYAKDLLSRQKGQIIFDVKCSQALEETIAAAGGEPFMYRTGHSLIKSKLKETGAPLGGEMSGHMFFADDWYGFDDAVYAAGRLLQIVANDGRKVSEMLAEIPKYPSSPEIRMDCPEDKKFQAVEAIRSAYRETHDVIEIDGARINFGDGWGLVRASNTGPILVLRIEAKTEERLKEIQSEIEGKLKEFI